LWSRLDLKSNLLDDNVLSSGTVDDVLKAATARQKLASRIEEFNHESSRYIPDHQPDEIGDTRMGEMSDSEGGNPPSESDDEWNELADIQKDQRDVASSTTVFSETMSLNLPSEMGIQRCNDLGIVSERYVDRPFSLLPLWICTVSRLLQPYR
jgi:hypothetical protein